MTPLRIELDEQTGLDLQARALAEGLKPQEWVERPIRRHVHPQWPDSVRALAGSWPDFPSAEELREDGGQDVARSLDLSMRNPP